MADDLRTDLDQLFLEARQRPILDRLRRRQRAQKVAEIVRQRMKLEPDGVGGERAAGKPRPFDRALPLLDPVLARAALVVEGDHIPGRPRHVGDHEADARIKFAGWPAASFVDTEFRCFLKLEAGYVETNIQPGFKVEAVRLVKERGVSVAQASRDLEIHENMLRRWAKELAADPAQAFPSQGQSKPDQVEIERLRREMAKPKAERNILKKAAAFFAREAR